MASTPESTKPTASPPCDHLKKLMDFEHPDQSAERFAAAAKQSAAEGDTNCELEALTQLARAQGLQGQFDKANATLDAVDQRLAELAPGRPHLRSKLERGRVFNSSRQPERAYPFFVAAYELGKQLAEDGLTVDALHMVAIAKIKSPEEALVWNLKALEFAKASQADDARVWLGSLFNNIGWTYSDQGEYEKALEMFKQDVEFREGSGTIKPLLIAKWSVARALRALGRTEEALTAQRRLLEEYAQQKLEPTGYVYEELGECTLALGKPGYQGCFAQAFAALSGDEWLKRDEPERLERLRRLSHDPAHPGASKCTEQ